MSNHISIQELLSKLWDSTKFPLKRNNSIINIEGKIEYIYPELEIKVENISKPFIIISAPGAVGKTTFAKFSANLKKGYYWDLSSLKLGDNTFSGTLLETFGVDQISSVLAAISRGEITLFIDSLDEAEIVSGWYGIEKFLIEVVKYTKDSPRPNIVIFSRSETALEIQMKLDEIGGDDCYSVYQIDYFSEEKGISFIENRILQKPSKHNQFKGPFQKAVQNIFTTIGLGINDRATKLWDDEEIRCFLGYSPVLQTIGDFLFDQNYEEIAKQFESKQNVESGLEIIKDFISRILIRDNEKFIKGLKEKISATPEEWKEWKSIYSENDQIKFVLNCIAKRPIKEGVESVSKIPSWLDKGFSDSLNFFIQNHPFIKDSKFSSPAFRDYVLASLVTDEEFETACVQLLTSGHFVLTPLFAFFYKSFNKNICKAGHIGLIYESVSSRTTFNGNTLLTSIRRDNTRTVLEIINSSGSKSDNILMECLTDDENPIILNNRLSNALIEVDTDVVLGRKGGSFDIQNAEIIASTIKVEVKDLFISGQDGSNSILIAKKLENSDHTLNITTKGIGTLIVNGNGSQSYPWSMYYKEYDKSSVEDYRDEIYILKRILEPFRKHGRGEFAKQSEFIDNEIIKNIPLRINLLSYLIELGIIKKGPGSKYYMQEDISVKYGISWAGLKSLNYNNELIKFLASFRSKYN